jgi:hypothetical protein
VWEADLSLVTGQCVVWEADLILETGQCAFWEADLSLETGQCVVRLTGCSRVMLIVPSVSYWFEHRSHPWLQIGTKCTILHSK